MNDFEDFQSRVDRLRAETDREIEADRRRRFTLLGFHRDPKIEVRSFLVDTVFEVFLYVCAALVLAGAVVYGLFFV